MSLRLFALVTFLASGVDGACDSPLLTENSKLQILDKAGNIVAHHGGEDGWILDQTKLGYSLLVTFESPVRISSLSMWGGFGSFKVETQRDNSDRNQWRPLREASGQLKILRTGKSAQDVDLVAGRVRIQPLTLSTLRSALKIQMWGCAWSWPCRRFHADGAGLAVERRGREMGDLRLGFRTLGRSGVLVSVVSDRAHTLLAQLKESRVQVLFDYGWGVPLELSSRAGLDDGLWHQVALVVIREQAQLFVDGVRENVTHLPPHRVPNIQPLKVMLGAPSLVYPLLDWAVRENLSGCMEAVELGGEEVLGLAETGDCSASWDSGDVVGLGEGAWVERGVSSKRGLRLSFRFRTLARDAALLSFPVHGGPVSGFKLTVNNSQLQLQLEGIDNVDDGTNDIFKDLSLSVCDGGWHSVELRETGAGLLLLVDGRGLELSSAALHLPLRLSRLRFGGDGFQGCLRALSFDGHALDGAQGDAQDGDITEGRCALHNGCDAHPCESGKCVALGGSGAFSCRCPEGRVGADCSGWRLPRTCAQAWDWGRREAQLTLDVDGPGPSLPFPAQCKEEGVGGWVASRVGHDALGNVTASGFEARGSFRYALNYDAEAKALARLVDGSRRCYQETSVSCVGGARLMSGGAWSWWSGRGGSASDAWGGAPHGTHACDCTLTDSCKDNGRCNCDSGKDSTDIGTVREMEFLPITRLFLGDTNRGGKALKLSVAPLSCAEQKWDDPVTFTSRGSVLRIPHSVNTQLAVTLEFRTTLDAGLLLYAESAFPHSEWVKLYLTGGDRVVVELAAGGEVWVLEAAVAGNGSAGLADSDWHWVQFSATRAEASLVIDDDWTSAATKTGQLLILPNLGPEWLLGGAGDSGGFLGSLRRVALGGDAGLDLGSMSHGVRDIASGLSGRCRSNSCGNGGRCLERYDGFDCDCSKTPFTGALCLTEVSSGIGRGSWLELSVKRTEAVNWNGVISLGFRLNTLPPSTAVLLSAMSAFSDSAFNLTINTSGHMELRVRTASGEEDQVTADRRSYADGTFHAIQIFSRAMDTHFKVDHRDELRLDGIQVNLTGKSSFWNFGSAALDGCLSGVSIVGGLPALKMEPSRLIRRGPPPPWSGLRCSSAPPPRLAAQTRREGKVATPWRPSSSSLSVRPIRAADYRHLLIGLGVAGLVLVVCAAWVGLRWLSAAQGGVYKTHEGEPSLYLSPDNSAAALMPTKREWFI